MKALILAAGRFAQDTRDRIGQGLEPRLDVFELADRLPGSELIDFSAVDQTTSLGVRLVKKRLGYSAAVAWLGYQKRHAFDVILTTGEDIGIPLATLLRPTHSKVAHAMIAHTLAPKKKQVFFDLFQVERRMDHVLVYATKEENLMLKELKFEPAQVRRIYYHADDQFFFPRGVEPVKNLICAAGQLLRDYDCLIDATRDLPVRVQIAAGSPWIDQKLNPSQALPENISWGKMSRFELRELYSRAALAVVPIKDNVYQTGIATILEMMAMGKCVIATKTQGQTDTIVDGQTGVYVPPHDPKALRAAIEHYLAFPEEALRIGARARAFVEQEAGLNLFVDRMLESMHSAIDRRRAQS